MRTKTSSWQRLWLQIGLAACVVVGVARAEAPAGVAGRWRTIDDETGQPKAVVEIREVSGAFEGRIVELVNPPVADPVCEACSGERKNKPVRGMTIVWGMKREGGDAGRLAGGRILDPKSGKEYRCSMKLVDGGKRLQVRGYVGFSLLGRTQTWLRAP